MRHHHFNSSHMNASMQYCVCLAVLCSDLRFAQGKQQNVPIQVMHNLYTRAKVIIPANWNLKQCTNSTCTTLPNSNLTRKGQLYSYQEFPYTIEACLKQMPLPSNDLNINLTCTRNNKVWDRVCINREWA